MYTNRIDTTGNPIYEEVNSFGIICCPYCWKVNYIPCTYTTGDTTGIIYCDKCGELLNKNY